MDLRSIANQATSTVNNNESVTVSVSTGYTIGSGGKQSPTYATPVMGFAQIQAVDSGTLRLMEKLNIQGTMRIIIMRGELASVVRTHSKGGDLVQYKDDTWLIMHVLEQWTNWVRAVMVLQEAPQ